MMPETEPQAFAGSRRRFLALAGGASAMLGGLSLVSGCDDGVKGAENAVSATPTSTATPTLPPTYTATDSDWLNFHLQVHYLLAAYLQRALDGGTIAANLTTGTGTAGSVSGGRQVAFSDTALVAAVREVQTATLGRIGWLRRTLGSAATAQPALNIAGGQGSPFQAIAVKPTDAAAATTFFDPYASEKDFLLGAVALFAVSASVASYSCALLGTTYRAAAGLLCAGIESSNAILRNATFVRADQEPTPTDPATVTLFSRATVMSDARDSVDGASDLDQNLGGFIGKTGVGSNVAVIDANGVAIRRTAEQALGVLYASVNSVSSGAFFPSGLNGTIRVSGANFAPD